MSDSYPPISRHANDIIEGTVLGETRAWICQRSGDSQHELPKLHWPPDRRDMRDPETLWHELRPDWKPPA